MVVDFVIHAHRILDEDFEVEWRTLYLAALSICCIGGADKFIRNQFVNFASYRIINTKYILQQQFVMIYMV